MTKTIFLFYFFYFFIFKLTNYHNLKIAKKFKDFKILKFLNTIFAFLKNPETVNIVLFLHQNLHFAPLLQLFAFHHNFISAI